MRRVMVTGSRDWQDKDVVFGALDREWDKDYDLVIVHGACPTGADAMADEWATINGRPVERYPADWATHGRAAGPKRNQAMIDTKPDALLAFSRDHSRGTEGTLKMAYQVPMLIRVYREESVSTDA